MQNEDKKKSSAVEDFIKAELTLNIQEVSEFLDKKKVAQTATKLRFYNKKIKKRKEYILKLSTALGRVQNAKNSAEDKPE